MCARILIASCALVALIGCGARTDLQADEGSGADRDGGSDGCGERFERCDGDVEDCARAFERGCECGDAPWYVAARGSRLASWPVLLWTGEHLALPVMDAESASDPEGWQVLVLDAVGARVVRSIPYAGLLFQADGPTLYASNGLDELHFIDARTGEVSAHRFEVPFLGGGRLIPIGDGDFVVSTSSNRPAPRSMHIGLLRRGDREPVWWQTLAGRSRARRTGWDGEVLALQYDSDLFLYEPGTNTLAGPVDYTELREEWRAGGMVRSARGWIALLESMTDPSTSEYRFLSLTPDGSPRGPDVRWRDEEADDRIVRSVFHADGGEVLFAYERPRAIPGPPNERGSPTAAKQLVVLPVGEDAELGEPRVLVPHYWSHGIAMRATWAGYSWVIAYDTVSDEGVSEVRVQRVCPAR